MQIDDAATELAYEGIDSSNGADERRRPVRQHALAASDQDDSAASHANTHRGGVERTDDLGVDDRLTGAPAPGGTSDESSAKLNSDVASFPAAAPEEDPTGADASTFVALRSTPEAVPGTNASDVELYRVPTGALPIGQIVEDRVPVERDASADDDADAQFEVLVLGPIASAQEVAQLPPAEPVAVEPKPEAPSRPVPETPPAAAEPVVTVPVEPSPVEEVSITPEPSTPGQPEPAVPPPIVGPVVEVEITPVVVTEPTAEPVPVTNSAPELASHEFTMAEDTSLTIRAEDLLKGSRDADGDRLDIVRVASPDGVTVTAGGDGTWVVQGEADWHGTFDLTYEASDGRGGTAVATAQIVVEDVPEKLQLVTTPGDLDAVGDQILHVTNPNSTAVEFNWEAVGTDRRGTLTAAPGETNFSIAGLDHGEVRIVAGGELQDSAAFDLANPRLDLHGAASVEEGDAGTRYVTYKVTLDHAVNRAIDVFYDVKQSGTNTATLGEDVQAEGGRLTLAAGQTSASFQIAVYGDQAFEGDQAYKVQLRTGSPDVDLGIAEVITTIVEGQDDLALRSAIHVEFSQLYSPDIAWNDEKLEKWQADGPRAEWGVDQAYAGGKAELSYADAQTMSVESNGWNVMKAVHVESAESGHVSIKDYVYADVTMGDGGTSTITVDGVKRGHIETGDGDDRIVIGIDTNSSDTVFNTVAVASGGGDDRISLTGDRDGGVNGAAKAGTALMVEAGDGSDHVTIDGGRYASSTLAGGGGDDRLTGNIGRDTLFGGTGDDHLSGGANADNLDGGAGEDILIGGSGNDRLTGGAGDDIVVFGRGDGKDHADGGAGWVDMIQLGHPDGATPVAAGDWALTLSRGSIEHSDDGLITLSDDSAGSIKLGDGSELMFTGMEQIQF